MQEELTAWDESQLEMEQAKLKSELPGRKSYCSAKHVSNAVPRTRRSKQS